ncbi:hypothetical protein QE382_002632 [Sphingobacterium zeae]|uniref:DUF2809 domain-containing protein n=1 Tax=Sphingobacterium zeae TaxID=1776859 RepID=A0ABU0U6R6_9SPHI|nr:DUF2809 domain-containing protein [Sphingobacterium zeae]MDQ1150648.1 hypothetical protein [Sphingobacterium zeae]
MKSITKIQYLVLAITTTILGLLSRKIVAIPPICGDVLYAVMVYWLARFLFIKKSLLFSSIITVLFCFTIEFLQLIQSPFFVWIRTNVLLRLVFGQGFVWSDLAAYFLGAISATALDCVRHLMLKSVLTVRD